ncbi:SAF domain-containing protein [Embleya sp. NPDC050493]|uniref:SAF domain-containing protein n=1 Tax=Embleya sp. NPDC050493 TaxID=3363989 RepID=UPI003798C820
MSASGSFGASPGPSFGPPFRSAPAPLTRRPWRRVLARHRRGLAALSAAVAVFAVIVAVRPAPAPTGPILVAARDLPAGSTPGVADLTLVAMPTALHPAGVLHAVGQAAGVALTGPLRRGEPVTDVRVARSGGPRDTGTVALPARFADADAVAVLRPGDRIDVLAAPAPEHPGPARLIVPAALVVARPAATGASSTGALLILEVPRAAAAELAGAANGPALTYTIHRFVNGPVATSRE